MLFRSLLDVWHMRRGDISNEAIAAAPGKFVKSIELCDADADITGSLWEDTIHHRQLCGEGSFDVPAFIHAIRQTGFSGPYGVEILSDKFRKLPLKEMATRAFETTTRQFQLADELYPVTAPNITA